jgi:hypothetical protein
VPFRTIAVLFFRVHRDSKTPKLVWKQILVYYAYIQRAEEQCESSHYVLSLDRFRGAWYCAAKLSFFKETLAFGRSAKTRDLNRLSRLGRGGTISTDLQESGTFCDTIGKVMFVCFFFSMVRALFGGH